MKILTGTIIATKMNKTATISVTRFVAHPLYKKRMRRTKKFQVHDENGHAVGEVVNFVACAPISKSKKWKILEISVAEAKAPAAEVKATKEVKPKAVKSPKVSAKKPAAKKVAAKKK